MWVLVLSAAVVVGGCGGNPLTVGTTASAGGSGGASGLVASAPPSSGAAPAASAAPLGEAPPGAATSAGVLVQEYDVPAGGVLACGVSPTTNAVIDLPVAPASPTRPDGTCVENAYRRGGVCLCQDGSPNVCGDSCVDVTVDPSNCGACGRSCGPTSTCNAGTCGPPVANVVAPAAGCMSLHLATSSGTVYWTDQGHGTVRSQALAGCAATTLVSGEQNPTLLTTDGATLVWVTGPTTTDGNAVNPPTTTATIRALTLPGGTPRDLMTETNTTGGVRGLVLSADGQTLYYSADTRVRAVPVAGGVAFDISRDERHGIPTALTRDGDTIGTVTDFNGDVDAITVQDGVDARCGALDAQGNVIMANCEWGWGCNPEAFLGGLVLHDGNVYWVNGLSIEGAQIWNHGSKAFVADLDGVDGNATGFTGAPDFLYVAGGTGDGDSIYRSPYFTSTAVAIARGQSAPSSLAVDGSRLYWATADCAINSIAR